jgi:hydrogenase-4 component F
MENAAGFNQSAFNVAFILMLIGFGAKSGMVPFHTWMPQAYAKSSFSGIGNVWPGT